MCVSLSVNESSVPLSQLPAQCGYSVQTTWRDLRLMAQYDACHVAQEVWDPFISFCGSDGEAQISISAVLAQGFSVLIIKFVESSLKKRVLLARNLPHIFLIKLKSCSQ